LSTYFIRTGFRPTGRRATWTSTEQNAVTVRGQPLMA
jgi:hypothetical protein